MTDTKSENLGNGITGTLDLQFQHVTNKTDYDWFHARIRLTAKAIYKWQGLSGLATFWDFILSPTWSNAEHMATGYGSTPNRCPFCGCPVPHRGGNPLHYCDNCNEMLTAMTN